MSLLIMLFDVELPNELKGFLFYAQVSGPAIIPVMIVMSVVGYCEGDWAGVQTVCGCPDNDLCK